MLEELNLDNTEDKDYPEELTEYEWAWFHTTVPSPYRLLVDWSDIVIGYIKRQYGGAYTAIKYAQSLKKEVIIL